MKLEFTNNLPVRNYHHLQSILKEFSETDSQYLVLRDWEDEYKNITSMVASFNGACHRSKFNMSVHYRAGIAYVQKDV